MIPPPMMRLQFLTKSYINLVTLRLIRTTRRVMYGNPNHVSQSAPRQRGDTIPIQVPVSIKNLKNLIDMRTFQMSSQGTSAKVHMIIMED